MTQRGEMGGSVGRKLRREEIYVHLQLLHIVVQQKPGQHCKGIILHLKIKINKYNIYFLFTNDQNMKPRRRWHPTPVCLPGKSYGQGTLVGCSPWGREESDTTERVHFHFSLSCIREGNGNPLQCSCLKNPRDGGAQWAAIYGVAQSWTRLK